MTSEYFAMTEASGFACQHPRRRGRYVLLQVVIVSLGMWMATSWYVPAVRGESPLDEIPIQARDREHWSYRPLTRPQLPEVSRGLGGENEIDLFLQMRWKERDCRPVPEAPRSVLLRRLTLGLTGIPPTPEERDEFLADSHPQAYERVVDRLLSSPRFGHRWAQFWLDLARFAETDGYEHDKIRPQAWQYRDWVIQSANKDLGYDDFVRRQLAGDELFGNESPEAIATAFCLAGPDMPDINSQEERRHSLLNEMTGTVGAVFLATQIGCAQCHEHRFDPISQVDFFRLRAFFESGVWLERDRSVHTLQSRSEEETPVTRLAVRGDWRRPGPPVKPGFLRVVNAQDVPSPMATATTERPGRRTALANWLMHPEHPLAARVIANRVWQFHFGRGLCTTPSDFGLAGDNPTHPELLDFLATELQAGDWSLKKLHRRILLSAAYRQSSYLAEHDLPEGAARDQMLEDWRHNLEIDPGNRWFSRFPRRRLEGEFVRDSMLAVAGLLDERMGGPGVRPPLPDELRSTLLRGQWDVTEEQSQHYRRSIYVFARRNLRYPIFDVFDRPDANQSCPRRYESTTAPQSLLLLNSEFSWEMADQLARRVWTPEIKGENASLREAGDPTGLAVPDAEEEQVGLVHDVAAIHRAVRLAWGREAQSSEVAEATAFLTTRQASTPEDLQRARTQLCLAILNASEFLYID
jgi:hypothetical protein